MTPVVYPRGFLGLDDGRLQASVPTNDFLQTVRKLQFNKPAPKNDKNYGSNTQVDKLYKEFITNVSYISNFDFRQRILQTALNAFGTQSFLEWCLLQNANPFVTTMHKKFLNDTFCFIETGKRSVEITTWLNLVSISTVNLNTDTSYFNTKQFFGTDRGEAAQRSVNLELILISWTSQEGGFEDLLGTLAVLFGAIN